MLAAVLVFVLVTAAIIGGYALVAHLPKVLERRRLEQRLREVGPGADPSEANIVRQEIQGPLPEIDRAIRRSGAGSRLVRLIEQADASTTPSAVLIRSAAFGIGGGLLTNAFMRQPLVPVVVGIFAAAVPVLLLLHRRARRFRQFEEQFPEALDLISRAIRAGHAFQAALGMAAEELRAPVGPEFRKTFEQQNFGLPLREALQALADRVPLLDVRFFVTAVSIQRETGGNLAEILDNLAHVVRERFKILRQVRVHTAHGRITGFVLLGLPAFLGVALTWINPGHMGPLFEDRMGHMMLAAALVMQVVGFFWIRHVIRIEV